MNETTPETRLIHSCLREPEAAAVRLRRTACAARSVEAWDALLDLAAEHRVAAFVQMAVVRDGLALSPEASERLRSLTLLARARAMLIDKMLLEVGAALSARAIPAIALKGPALARTVYSSPALRTYDDLDLLVQAQDEAGAIETLLARGFSELPDEAEDAWTARGGAVDGEAHYHRRFLAPGAPALLELHADPLQIGLAPACEAGRWQRARPLPGIPGVHMLGPEDQVVQLSVHAHKHGYSRLIWLKDIDLLLRAEEGCIDWSLVGSVAEAEGVSAAVWYTLQLTAALFGAPLPAEPLRRLRPSPIVRALYRRIWPAEAVVALRGRMHRRAAQFRPADAWRGSLPGLVLMGRRADRARAGLRATARRLATRPGRSG